MYYAGIQRSRGILRKTLKVSALHFDNKEVKKGVHSLTKRKRRDNRNWIDDSDNIAQFEQPHKPSLLHTH